MPTATLYRGSYGLSNRVPPELIPYNHETGVVGLQTAENVLIGEAGQIYGRRGSRQVFSFAGCHSLFPVPGGFLFVQDQDKSSVLSRAIYDYSGSLEITELKQLRYNGDWLDWFIYRGEYWYGSARERGIVETDCSSVKNWRECDPPARTEREYRSIPKGKFIGRWHEYTLSAVGNLLFFSEIGYSTICSIHNVIALPAEITMVAPVEDGIFISDNNAVHYLYGNDPGKWAKNTVYAYPAIPYCRLYGVHNLVDIGVDQPGTCVVFMTVQGPCVGMQDGAVLNLIDKNFRMPNCHFNRGSMTLANNGNLIISLE